MALLCKYLASRRGTSGQVNRIERIMRFLADSSVAAAAAPNVPDFHPAGGVPAVMCEILPLLHGDALTVTGMTVAENLAKIPEGEQALVRLSIT